MEVERVELNSSIFLPITTVVLLVVALLLSLLRSYVLQPASARRSLLQQGFHVLPYRPIGGDLPDLKRMEAAAQLCDMPSASNHHHLLFPRLFPFHHKHLSQHGDDVPFVYWWGTQPTVVITNAEDAKWALSADVKHFRRSEASSQAFHRLLGKGLLFANGEDWHYQRNTLRPAFFAEKLKEMVAHMSTSALQMAGVWMKQVNEQGPTEIEVAKPIKDVTADILARTSFGSSYLKGKKVFDMQVQLLRLLAGIRVQTSVIPGYRFLPTHSNHLCMELEEKINTELLEVVESRRNTIQEEGHAAHSYGSDLLGLILAAEDEEVKEDSQHVRFSTQQVIDECKTFFFAGHETTANLLAWTMVLLAMDEEWQDRAREEVLEVCGKQGDITPDHINRLKMMSMVLNESLRLYPPVPEYGRRVMNPTETSFKLGHRTLPKGTAFVIECLYIHRRKDIWGADANEFNPERFSTGVVNACKHPYGFIPFGIGPRICIGQHFALMEAKVIMAVILQHFRFHLSPNYRHAPLTTITMRPKHGVQVIIEALQ